MMRVVVFDALGTEWFYAGHCRAEVGKGLALMLETSVLDQLGGHLGSVEVGVVTSLHFLN